MFGHGARLGVSWDSSLAASRRASSGANAPWSAPAVCVFRSAGTTRTRSASGCHPSHTRRICSAKSRLVRRAVTVTCRRPAVGSTTTTTTTRFAVPVRAYPQSIRAGRPGAAGAGGRASACGAAEHSSKLTRGRLGSSASAYTSGASSAAATNSPLTPPGRHHDAACHGLSRLL